MFGVCGLCCRSNVEVLSCYVYHRLSVNIHKLKTLQENLELIIIIIIISGECVREQVHSHL